MFKTITHCERCGTCCNKGGPALHQQDKHLLLSGHLGYHNLITIRKGEPAFSPVSGSIECVNYEFVKIAGKGAGWNCCLLDESGQSCTIYKNRPLECRLLKCWDSAELLDVIGKDTLTRFDIINPDSPVLEQILIHEDKCSAVTFELLISACINQAGKQDLLEELAEIANYDLLIRSRAVAEFSLTLPMELFFFGRPLFKLLGSRGITVQEHDGSIRLIYDASGNTRL